MPLPALPVAFRGESPAARFPPPGVRAVVFDVVHTLVEPWPSVPAAYRAAGLRHGIDLGEDAIRARFGAAWRRAEALDAEATPPFATSPERERDRWRGVVAAVFREATDTAAIFADLWDHFGRPESWRALPAGRALVMATVDAGVPIALASNFDERLNALASVVEPLTSADHVFASSDLGWRKPSPRFFRAVEERLGLQAQDLLLVGDDADLDVAAAREAGWQAQRLV
jgi:putative hydrolase of the HAD superfamily